MYKKIIVSLASVAVGLNFAFAQKKPLDHSVYDSWEHVSYQALSRNGQWSCYAIAPQQGDGTLYFYETLNAKRTNVPRAGYAVFSNDSKFAVFNIKPFFKATRQAKIDKKKPAEMPKDSLGIINLSNLQITKEPNVKSFKMPKEASGWLAYLAEKAPDSSKNKSPEKKDGYLAIWADDEKANKNSEGTDLTLRNLTSGSTRAFKYVTEYSFSENGKLLAFNCTGSKKDKSVKPGAYLLNLETGKIKTLVNAKGSFKGFTFDEESEHMAFLGETDSEKQEIKNYNVYFTSLNLDTAQVLVDDETAGIPHNYAVSEDGLLRFSKDGERLFLGIAPKKLPKDTTLVDFEHAKLDVWGYKDDYLQPMQLKNLGRENKRNYLSVIDVYSNDPKVIPLANLQLPDAQLMNEGDAPFVLASTNYGNRISSQWEGETVKDYFLVDTKTGAKKKIIERLTGFATASPGGNYVLFFDKPKASWFTYDVVKGKTTQLNAGLTEKFVNEENDVPDYAQSYGTAGWLADDKGVLIYDKYDIWLFSPDGKKPKNITNRFGRSNKLTLRINNVEDDFKFFDKDATLILDAFDNNTKEHGFFRKAINSNKNPELLVMAPAKFEGLKKSKYANVFLYTQESFSQSPNLFISKDLKTGTKLSETNKQQANYNWGTASLVKWTTPKGYKSEGILYKPENFDAAKKYPMIVYFYEKLSDRLFEYLAPAPTPSALNISYFVSNGYLVFTPDISYEIGHPGKSAVEYINSGVEELKKNSWVDGTKIGIQGQSWGGYQVAYLITATNMYAAAWAGAPVVNMTSAYGGIRWESGVNRQFQYEKTQSRIGATLWEKPELYIENSPLFNMPKVNTPVVIMANDADGAVPWYQGIEMFTALKRLGKPSWLLNYNNEAHNLMERQNRKDLQIREQQFFDYYLKGAKAPVWMTSGIPATEKGRNWGFELTNEKP